MFTMDTSYLLCIFGFFREMRPSEPFVTEYLSSENYHNITVEQVNKEIYPLGTYAVLIQLILIFLITDILRYKPIIILSAVAGIVLFAILLWARTVWQLQIGQMFYGTFMATEVAYYTYIYAKVKKEDYQIVTGKCRSAILFGKFLGGFLAQILISMDAMDYRGLHFISFGSQILSLFVALSLPSVRKSIYFYSAQNDITIENSGQQVVPAKLDIADAYPPSSSLDSNTLVMEPTFSWQNASQLLIKHIKNAYTQKTVVQWSIWWAFATCGQVQVISYVQFLWKDIDPYHESFYNGGVEAIVTLLGAGSAIAAGYFNANRSKHWHLWIITFFTVIMGVFLISSSLTNLIEIAYVMYILFGICYFFIITLATAIVAANLPDDSFALIFGINTFIALLLQTILTLIVVTDTGYGLNPRSQFFVYGCYFVGLSILYSIAALLISCRKSR